MKKLTFNPARRNVLQLDIDSGAKLTEFWKRLRWFSCMADAPSGPGLRAVSVTRSRSGNWHAEIILRTRLPLMERIALQAILGSDLDRELCNYERVKCHSLHPILLINIKEGR